MWHSTRNPPTLAYSAEEALAMDHWLVDERGLRLHDLMETAGARLADAVREIASEKKPSRIAFLVGPGHNGGDALVAHRRLGSAWPASVWRPLAGDAPPLLDATTLVVDGLFGVGLTRPIEGRARAAVEHVRASPAAVLAVDVPSGLCATTGAVKGGPARPSEQPGAAIRADWTLTFVGPKQGFFRGAGRDLVGLWKAVDIGFPVQEAEAWVRRRRGT